jgi:hypothetical protein
MGFAARARRTAAAYITTARIIPRQIATGPPRSPHVLPRGSFTLFIAQSATRVPGVVKKGGSGSVTELVHGRVFHQADWSSWLLKCFRRA